ncbi:MAG: hypothetical protein KAI47_02500, partial [Deltaproteobacteria bacterium]|nr:hypothetical protein [Deltaproteobacteria bacterium]
GPPTGLDILFVTTHDLGGARTKSKAIALVEGLRLLLTEKLSRLSPADVHFATTSPLLPQGSRCVSSYHPKDAALLSSPDGRVVSPGTVSWTAHAGEDYMECWHQNYLEATTRAIDGRNPGFPRPGALLVIFIVAGPDDCSVKDLKLWYDDSLWSPKYGSRARCYFVPDGFLYPVKRYPPRILAAHGQRSLVVVVGTRRPLKLIVDPGDPRKRLAMDYSPCGYEHYYPAPRLGAFVDAITRQKHPRLHGLFLDRDCLRDVSLSDLETIANTIVRYGEL